MFKTAIRILLLATPSISLVRAIEWQLQAYEDENCGNETITERGYTTRDCVDTSGQLRSYRFTSTIDPETNETFSVRLYDMKECTYLSVIDDQTNGKCSTASFNSFNLFAPWSSSAILRVMRGIANLAGNAPLAHLCGRSTHQQGAFKEYRWSENQDLAPTRTARQQNWHKEKLRKLRVGPEDYDACACAREELWSGQRFGHIHEYAGSLRYTVASPAASVIHTFVDASGISGITEIAPDVFALITGVWDLATTRAELGSLAVWTVDFTGLPNPLVKFVTSIENSTIFSGIVRHPSNPEILSAADSALGAVWRIDLTSGVYNVAFSSPLLAPTGTAPGTNLGINGIKAAGSHVYFTNSPQKLFGRVAVDENGNQARAVEILSNSTGAGSDVVYDDIALNVEDGSGTA
ncbi:hypothetical protein B0H67DRAFT_676425 [Lasiosphaeris hirsuta]|uniref:Uncharacterized protein n=1 Tax=Lasiosphaeris hirsuta TaxID=260670 RepID=A0AA40DJJ5_9PEZI|nr:hypothetical protein B0H67DRAFT_676425 [Lasiosphaeris hirsuta]